MTRRSKYPTGCGIYAIEHIESGKRYIGSSQTMEYRLPTHVWKLRKGIHHSRHLQAAWNKYGEDAFRFILVLRCDSPEDLIEAEQLEIEMHGGIDNCYNVAPYAGAPMRGRKMSEETRARMSKAQKCRAPISEETRERLRQAAIDREAEKKARGYVLPESARKKLSESHKGHAVSEETRRKLSEANKGKASPPEHYERLSQLYRGRKHPEEQKRKIAEASKRMWASPEARAAHSQRMKEFWAAKNAAKQAAQEQ